MTRTDVKKLAWTLRLIGFGLLAGAVAVMFLGTAHTSAAPSSSSSARVVR